MSITATRFHDFSYGHRVVGHESCCAHLHGHNGRAHFTVRPLLALDSVGRVLDFSVINARLCEWLEAYWDHRMLIWEQDPWAIVLEKIDSHCALTTFNPTAENMARYLGEVIGPEQLVGTNCVLCKVTIEETRKCKATWKEEDYG